MGWEVFQSLEKFCKTDLGYTGIKDVYSSSSSSTSIERIDDMPSYFIAETLKYLLLLFGPDDFIPLNQFVFTTEAHPLRRLTSSSKTKFEHLQRELSSSKYNVPAPFPWLMVAAVLAIVSVFIVLAISFCFRKRTTVYNRHRQL